MALLLRHVTVNFGGAEAEFFIKSADLPRMIDRAGNGDNLVVKAVFLPHHQTPAYARLSDMPIAFRRERYASPEPRLLA